MNKITFIITLVLLSFSVTAIAQPLEDRAHIKVDGIAEMDIIPNEIYISIKIKEQERGREKISIAQQEKDLKQSLTEIGVPLTDLYLSDANSSYIRISWGKKVVVDHAEYLLKVGDAATLAKSFQALDKLNLTQARIVKVDHSEMDSLKREVKIMAIKAAKEKANYLLSAIGEETGKALFIEERYNTVPSVAMSNVRGGRSMENEVYVSGVKISEIIQIKKITLAATIQAIFEIK